MPSISKIFERVVYIQVYDFFVSNNLFFDNQYGYRKHHSTEHAALELVDRIYETLDNGEIPIAVFLDLSKAFDTINHKILLEKLVKYGFQTKALKWFSSYLSHRIQCVDFKSNLSPFVTIDKGVPQGSILGPLLFLIFINDMHNCSKDFASIMFADDTTLTNPLCTFSGDDMDTGRSINTELEKVCNWLAVNQLR